MHPWICQNGEGTAGGPSRYQIELEKAGNSQQKTTKPPTVKANSLSCRELGALLFTAESQAQETGIMVASCCSPQACFNAELKNRGPTSNCH